MNPSQNYLFSRYRALGKVAVLAGLLLASPSGQAYQWMKNITAMEYYASTPMCKRAIAIWNSNHNGKLGFAPMISREESLRPENWNNGDKVIWQTGGWHYCGGAIRIGRGERVDLAPELRAKELDRGVGSANYTWRQIDKSEPWAAEIGTTMARGYMGMQEYEKALEYARTVVEFHPNYVDAYTIAGMVYYRNREYGEAKQLFARAIEVSGGKSAQAHYFMGLAQLKTNDLEAARHHAAEAERLGYPLPGLKNMIARAERTPS